MKYFNKCWANKNAQQANKRFHVLSEREWADKSTRQIKREWNKAVRNR